jgi:DNA-binding GntR family transcriptional regulator
MLPWTTHPPAATRLADVRDTSLARIVRDEILGRILRGDLAPGDRINEPDVAERLGVSRVPVREALRALESSGLVVSRKNAGVFVRSLDAAEVAQLYEFRALLDSFAARRAGALADAPRRVLLKVLDSATAAMRKAARKRDVPAYYAENLRFHWAIVEAAGNPKVSDSYRDLVQQLHVWRVKNLSQGLAMAASIEEHEAIMQAIRDADPERCARLIAAHVGAAHARLEQTLHKESPR